MDKTRRRAWRKHELRFSYDSDDSEKAFKRVRMPEHSRVNGFATRDFDTRSNEMVVGPDGYKSISPSKACDRANGKRTIADQCKHLCNEGDWRDRHGD